MGSYENKNNTRINKGKSIISFPSTYCVLDLETTGLSPKYDRIIEVGVIKYSSGVECGRFNSLIRPYLARNIEYVDAFITSLTGITNEMLENAPVIEEVIEEIDGILNNETIVGYNVGFDINFLYDSFIDCLNKPFTNNYIDVMRIARKVFPEMRHHRLCDMIEMFGLKNDIAHRAMADVEATAICYNMLHDEVIKQFGNEESFINLFNMSKRGFIDIKTIVGDPLKNNPDSPLYNKYCVFTGKLEKYTRKEAMQLVADLGGINESGVTANTNYLILGSNDDCSTIVGGKSSKQKKAEKYQLQGQDILIIPELDFYEMIDEY